MKPRISVILPVYNVENYLKKCIDSVCGQTYKNLEIILVDDGATDSCPQLCDEFAKKDERIRVLHKENGGLSDARNAGAKIATGEYITFVDSDDTIESTYIEYLYSLIEKYQTPMSLCTHSVVFESGKTVLIGDGTDESLSAHDVLKRMLYHDIIDTSAWAKMYHRSLVEQIQYPKGMLFEDIGTTYKFFLMSKKVACGYKSQYNYMIRSNSIVTGKFNPKKFHMLEMTDAMAEEVSKVYPDLKDAVLRRRVYARFSTLNQLANVTGYDTERMEIIAFIKEHAKQVQTDPLTPKRDRLAIGLLKIGYPVYRICWSIMGKK